MYESKLGEITHTSKLLAGPGTGWVKKPDALLPVQYLTLEYQMQRQSQQATQLSVVVFCSQNCNYKYRFSREISLFANLYKHTEVFSGTGCKHYYCIHVCKGWIPKMQTANTGSFFPFDLCSGSERRENFALDTPSRRMNNTSRKALLDSVFPQLW